MSSLQKSVEASPIPNNSVSVDDPWYWSVDQVVVALCDHHGPFLHSIDSILKPDPISLEKALRENVIGGAALLTGLTSATLREELGIRPLGHRTTILHLIKDLQRKSEKYHQHIQLGLNHPYLSGYEEISGVGQTPRFVSPYFGFPIQHGPQSTSTASGITRSPKTPSGYAHQFHHTPLNATENWSYSQQQAISLPQNELLQGLGLLPSEQTSIDSAQPKEISSAIADTGNENQSAGETGRDLQAEPISAENQVNGNANQSVLSSSIVLGNNRQGESFVIGEGGKKRRRLILTAGAPTQEPENDQEALTTISEPAVTSVPPRESENVSAEQIEKPEKTILQQYDNHSIEVDLPTPQENHAVGQLVIDNEGRKRMKPIPVTPINRPLNIHPSGLRKPENSYLGPGSLAVDTLFYGNSLIGQEINNDVTHGDLWQSGGAAEYFIFFDDPFARGQRRYVGGRIKSYLSSSLSRVFNHQGQPTILPYPSLLARKNHPVSATVFRQLPGGLTATRVNRSKWLGDDFDVSRGQLSNADPFSDPNEVPTQAAEAEMDWDYLNKWNYGKDKDEILPVYGDSDLEYDTDTWREMMQEQIKPKKLERSSGQLKRMKLSNKEIDEAIKVAMEHTIKHWEQVREPKLRLKAWKLWMKSQRDNSRHSKMALLLKVIENLELRLGKLVQEIQKIDWSTVEQVQKQCKSLQPSQFDLEDSKWKLSMLNSKVAPERPLPQPKKPLKAQLIQMSPRNSEEDMERTHSEPEISESDLGSFVVDEDSETAFFLEAGETSRTLDTDSLCTMGLDSLDYQNNEIKVEGMQAQNEAHQVEETAAATLLLQGHSANSVARHLDIIDLTQMSESSDQGSQEKIPDSSFTSHTLPLSLVGGEDPFRRDQERSAAFKNPPVISDTPPVIDLDSDTSGTKRKEDDMPSSQMGLHGFNEVAMIRQMNVDLLVERKDRKRLLIWTVGHTPSYRRQEVAEYVIQTPYHDIQSLIWTGLRAFKSSNLRIDGLKKEDSDTLMRIAAWYVCWTIPVKVSAKAPGVNAAHINTALADLKGFHMFYTFLRECLGHYKTDSNSQLIPGPQKRARSEDSDAPLQSTPNKKHRKKHIPESQETKDLRFYTQTRVEDTGKRQEQLKRRFQAMGMNEEEQQVIVNTGKHDDQGFIYLNPKIGDRIQKHQKEGLQFMWREVVAENQGCLLAQTMGLGKTMQVIALLVTIAEAARSSSENIKKQIPENLRKSRTLILCPVSLIENWWEEFLMWTPLPLENNIGELRKVSAALPLQERIREIKSWGKKGGVLIIGFNTFRDLISNNIRKGGKALDEVEHELVQSALLDSPSIIVADEAHAAKKTSSGLNRTMNQIKSKSRIALTGSPLANNLEEYHSLIDWIAPNYLGTIVQFKANYEERIREGLWQDSAPEQYRDSLKWLEVLKKELEPKIHRADISALQGRLKEKQEFVIRVPLTPLQEKIYGICVNTLASVVDQLDQKAPTVWALLSVLRLLCNHPKCFKDRLQARSKANKRLSKNKSLLDDLIIVDEVDALVDASVSEIGISQVMVDKQLAPFSDLTEPIESTLLSNKMLILDKIIQYSREAQDKTLIFSHTLDTLSYVEDLLKKLGARYSRIDGKVKPTDRQQITKDFNDRHVEVCLISTRAGGQGLNLYGANRVVIMDDHYNPMFEEQAVGRAYRIGQKKAVFVYHLMVGGTFEEVLHNQSVFKQQLAKRVVDNKNPARRALRGIGEYLRSPQSLEQKDLSRFYGKDHLVLDRILALQDEYVSICSCRS